MRSHPITLFAAAAALFAQTPASFTKAGSMTTARAGHTATLLNNGEVLIVGGSGDSSAELYDPATGAFAPTGDTREVLIQPTATLLPDGRVLIAGGTPNATAEIYDPASGTFNQTGNMTHAYYGLFESKAVLLPSGLVLLAGSNSADLYDSSTGIFSPANPYASTGHEYISTATLLSNGTVLLTGGNDTELWGQVYDPIASAFSVTDFNSLDLQKATLLETGMVLFEGGDCDPDDRAELYDPMTGIFDVAGQLVAWRRFTSTATLLTGGQILVTGTDDPGGTADARAELYDPASGMFTATSPMNVPRSLHAATLLRDGSVLVTGGYSPTDLVFVASAEIYHPIFVTPPPVLLSVGNNGQAAALHGSSQQIVSGQNPAQAGEAVEVYLTGLVDGNTMPPRISIDGKPAHILFFGDAPGFVGLNQINISVPSGIASGQATMVLSYMGRPSNQVYVSIQ